jgi:hypothetical protein
LAKTREKFGENLEKIWRAGFVVAFKGLGDEGTSPRLRGEVR